MKSRERLARALRFSKKVDIYIKLEYLMHFSLITSRDHLFTAMLNVSVMRKPYLANLIAGSNNLFQGSFPYFLWANSMPRSSPGTATDNPPYIGKMFALLSRVVKNLFCFRGKYTSSTVINEQDLSNTSLHYSLPGIG